VWRAKKESGMAGLVSGQWKDLADALCGARDVRIQNCLTD